MKIPGYTALLAVLLSVFVLSSLSAKVTILTEDENLSGAKVKFPFYIYQDNNCQNYYPTGWMGDTGDLNLSQIHRVNPYKGSSCIEMTYSARKSQNKGWAGIFWQNPMNNWGEARGGYDLTGARYLYFYARGRDGGESVEFRVGGISGNAYYDTSSATSGEIVLTREWKLYSIALAGKDLTRIIGGFCVLFFQINDPAGCAIYLDNILYSDQEISE